MMNLIREKFLGLGERVWPYMTCKVFPASSMHAQCAKRTRLVLKFREAGVVEGRKSRGPCDKDVTCIM